ncbi:Pectinesterase [Melia azedarach]|uniref:Pectinesterase n=1 Tax=Melia azedarach TaxID=155640 RepID=A0ACC1YHV1_MELAZ|nr:Pectinesterase [Melia azedarach]
MDVTTSWLLAKDLSIVNSAGPKGGQAVALRIAGDQIACYRCSIEGYQDTLFLAYGEHYFFYECNIFGTIDFIFGDSSVVFQNTFVYVRKPSTGQGNVIIPDGTESKEKNSAIVIHNCTINAASDLIPFKSTVKTYLGRPWKEYSRTIIMESYLGDLIDPEDWSKWNDSTFALTTLYYAEHANRGPGASVDGRVKWPGYHILHNPSEVQNFTVQNFIRGTEWLTQLGVPFIPNLIG